MKKMTRLTGALLALCLLLPLTCPAAAAEPAEQQLVFPESGGWPPELIGSWVGLHEDLWRQFMFLPEGNYSMTVFEDPGLDKTGTWETIEKADRVTVQGDLMRLTVRGTTGTFRRVPAPYVRLQVKDGSVTQSVDRALLGTWGGRIRESYVEWTFRGDGHFMRITPYEALREEGHCIAGGGSLAILLNGKMITCAYKARENFITVDLPDAGRLILNRRAGQLTEMDVDNESNFAWMFTQKELEGFVAQHYFGIETEVGIPGAVAYSAVVGISDEAFKGNKTVKSVTIPEFVIEIGNAAFEGCESLTDILFIGTLVGAASPSSYKEVGVTVIPGSCPLKTIGEGAFRGCVRLENLNIATSVNDSPHNIYWRIGQSDVKGINIPDGVTSIGAMAFEGCESITSVAIPNSVTQIGKDAFKGCGYATLIVGEGSCAHQYAMTNGIHSMFRGK